MFRRGGQVDLFGHKWHLASRKENVSVEEMRRLMSGGDGER